MNSQEANRTPAAMVPGPMMRQVDVGASGSGRTSGRRRCLAGNRQDTEEDTSSCCLVITVIPSQDKGDLGQDRTARTSAYRYERRGPVPVIPPPTPAPAR